MHFGVLKIQFQAFFENSKRYNEKGRRYNAYGKGAGFSSFFFKQCYVLSKTVLSLQEIGAVSIET